jgi:hypothetical protein
MRHLATLVLPIVITFAACDMQGEKTMNFFDKYSATDLGSTKIVTANAVVGLRGEMQKMLDISVDDDGACSVDISIRAEYSVTVDTGIQTVGGPLVGLLQWGVGGGSNQVEFDIPTARLPASLAPNALAALGTGAVVNAPTYDLGRGVKIRLGSASHVSLTVRSDGNMSPLNNPGGDFIGNNAAAKIIAFAGPSDMAANTPLERSLVAAGGNAGSPLAPLGVVFVTIPPFAKSVRFERTPAASPMLVTFFTNNGVAHRNLNVAVNDEGPFPLAAASDHFSIINQGAANIDWITCVFDVTP